MSEANQRQKFYKRVREDGFEKTGHQPSVNGLPLSATWRKIGNGRMLTLHMTDFSAAARETYRGWTYHHLVQHEGLSLPCKQNIAAMTMGLPLVNPPMTDPALICLASADGKVSLNVTAAPV